MIGFGLSYKVVDEQIVRRAYVAVALLERRAIGASFPVRLQVEAAVGAVEAAFGQVKWYDWQHDSLMVLGAQFAPAVDFLAWVCRWAKGESAPAAQSRALAANVMHRFSFSKNLQVKQWIFSAQYYCQKFTRHTFIFDFDIVWGGIASGQVLSWINQFARLLAIADLLWFGAEPSAIGRACGAINAFAHTLIRVQYADATTRFAVQSKNGARRQILVGR